MTPFIMVNHETGVIMKIGIYYDEDYLDPKYLAFFLTQKGIDGEQVVDLENERYQIQLLGGELSPGFNEYLAKGHTELQDNILIDVLDDKGQRVGDYFLADVQNLSIQKNSETLYDLSFDAFQWSVYPGSFKCMTWWAEKRITKIDMWKKLPKAERQGWLNAALINGKRSQKNGQSIEIEGLNIDDRNAFYCALGEAVNGPGGYFGRCLGGVNDCLGGDFGPIPTKVTWVNSAHSQSQMTDFDELVKHLKDIFSTNKIEFVLT